MFLRSSLLTTVSHSYPAGGQGFYGFSFVCVMFKIARYSPVDAFVVAQHSRVGVISAYLFVEQVSQALEGKCRVLKLDSDEEEAMAGALNVSTNIAVDMAEHRQNPGGFICSYCSATRHEAFAVQREFLFLCFIIESHARCGGLVPHSIRLPETPSETRSSAGSVKTKTSVVSVVGNAWPLSCAYVGYSVHPRRDAGSCLGGTYILPKSPPLRFAPLSYLRCPRCPRFWLSLFMPC